MAFIKERVEIKAEVPGRNHVSGDLPPPTHPIRRRDLLQEEKKEIGDAFCEDKSVENNDAKMPTFLLPGARNPQEILTERKGSKIQKNLVKKVIEKKTIPGKFSHINIIGSEKKIHPPTSTELARNPPTFRLSNGRVIQKRGMTSEADNSRPVKKSRWGPPQRPYLGPCPTVEQNLMSLTLREFCCVLEKMEEEEQLKLMMRGHPWDMLLGGREKMWRLCHKINMKWSIQQADNRMRIWAATMGIRDPDGLQIETDPYAVDLGVLPGRNSVLPEWRTGEDQKGWPWWEQNFPEREVPTLASLKNAKVPQTEQHFFPKADDEEKVVAVQDACLAAEVIGQNATLWSPIRRPQLQKKETTGVSPAMAGCVLRKRNFLRNLKKAPGPIQPTFFSTLPMHVLDSIESQLEDIDIVRLRLLSFSNFCKWWDITHQYQSIRKNKLREYHVWSKAMAEKETLRRWKEWQEEEARYKAEKKAKREAEEEAEEARAKEAALVFLRDNKKVQGVGFKSLGQRFRCGQNKIREEVERIWEEERIAQEEMEYDNSDLDPI